jgi:hemolysin activation/secretion protein
MKRTIVMSIHRFIAAALLLAVAAAHAQTIPPAADPGAIQQRQIEQERRLRQEEELRRAPAEKPVDTDALRTPKAPSAGDEVRFQVKNIDFGPSEILTREELDALAAPYRNRAVSLAEIRQLVAQVNELYRKKGVVTAQAILPPQDLTDGTVRIRLIEGRLGRISLQGNETTNESYVIARVRQQPGDLVDLPSLELDLRRFNRTNDVQARAELKPGTQVGQTDINLILTEPALHELRLFSDNNGSEQTGELRLGALYRNRSLFGRRDDLLFTTVRAEGQESYSLAYGAPINTVGTRLNVAYYDDETEVKNGPFAELKLNGEAHAWVGSLRHPLAVGDVYQIDSILGAKKRNTKNRFDQVLLQDTDTDDVSLGLEAQRVDSAGYWLASVTTARVRSQSLATDERKFDVWRGTLRRNHNISRDYAIVGAINWQHTSDELLPAGEQFLLGGEYSVRGYSSGVLSGDSGYTVNVELHHPVNLWKGDPRVTGFFFVDYGRVSVYRPPGDPRNDDESLLGVGWGANASVGKNVSMRFTYGSAQKERPEESHNYRIMAQLAWNLL